MSANKKEYDSTTNRYVYNRIRKLHLESVGEIRCSYCRYHRGENRTNEFYGRYVGRKYRMDHVHAKYPSWKLTSKNPKQWMDKDMRIVRSGKAGYEIEKFVF